jgi:hypothetical protein
MISYLCDSAQALGKLSEFAYLGVCQLRFSQHLFLSFFPKGHDKERELEEFKELKTEFSLG